MTKEKIEHEGIRLGFVIHDVSRMRRSAYDSFMKPLGVTRAHWWVLAHLSRHDGMMQTQLADILEVGKASLGAVVEKLESLGWVRRGPDPNDKRAKRVFLTRSGSALIARMTEFEMEFNQRILSELTPEELASTLTALNKIKWALLRLSPDTASNDNSDDDKID